MENAYILLGVMLVLVLIAGAVAVSYNLRVAGEIIGQFRALGEEFGLELTIPPRSMAGLYQRNPTLYGTRDGREMSIYPRGYGMDNTRQTDTAIRMITKAPKSLNLSLARKSLSGKLGQMGRLKEVTTGDDAFDRHFTLRSSHPGIAAVFDESFRRRLLEDWQANSGFLSLHDRALTYEEMGLPRNEQQRWHLEKMAHLCLELAQSLDGWSQ